MLHHDELIRPPHRDDLLLLLPENAVVAEFGVHRGDFAQFIWDVTRPTKLFLVDPWPPDTDLRNGDDVATGTECFDCVRARFAREIERGDVVLIRDKSGDSAPHFANILLDWIYLDTTHRHPSTLRELRVLSNLIKPDGLICGHDIDFVSHADGTMGVNVSVEQFISETEWKMTHLTCEPICKSFALMRS
jgi:hypothetical protein